MSVLSFASSFCGATQVATSFTQLRGSAKGDLLGASPLEKGAVSSWISLVSTTDSIDLASLNDLLLTRSFLASYHLTLADIVVYYSAHSAAVSTVFL
jgi:hypothetical protein